MNCILCRVGRRAMLGELELVAVELTPSAPDATRSTDNFMVDIMGMPGLFELLIVGGMCVVPVVVVIIVLVAVAAGKKKD